MIRIAHVTSTPEGFAGAETMIVQLVHHGARYGQEHLVFNPLARSENEALRDRVGADRYRPIIAGSMRRLPAMVSALQRELRAFRPDIVHAHLFHAELLVAMLPLSHDARKLLTHHHGAVFTTDGRFVRGLADQWAVRRFDHVVGVSESVSCLVRRWTDADRVTTILNGWSGIPLENRPPGRPTVVCVAAFRPEKGHSGLLRAMAIVVGSIPDARLVLVGDGPTRHQAQHLARSLGLQDRVVFTGAVDDVWPHYSKAHIFVLASTNEPFGIVALEAMAARLPVVVTDVGGLPEIVKNGTTGLIVPPGQPEALASAMVSLLTDERRRIQMGEAAYERAQGLTVQRSVEQYADLYRMLCSA